MKSIPRSLGWIAAFALLLAGCGDHDHAHNQSPSAKGGHHHDSAHGGVAVELGEHQFHLDFLHDAAAGTLTAWVMDAHVENFVRVSLPAFEVRIVAGARTNTISMEAVANASTGETVGSTSMFRARADFLKGLEKFSGQVGPLELRGTHLPAAAFDYPAAPHEH
ncbi:MAG: hypothetical protein IT581_13725 [Verrucomicrobiales bacterium]|nr:hypothetical protein [Verrucomicrobiales bacterium]